MLCGCGDGWIVPSSLVVKMSASYKFSPRGGGKHPLLKFIASHVDTLRGGGKHPLLKVIASHVDSPWKTLLATLDARGASNVEGNVEGTTKEGRCLILSSEIPAAVGILISDSVEVWRSKAIKEKSP